MTTALLHADIETVTAAVRARGVVAVVEEVLAALDDAPSGVLVGPPLRDRAVADAARLASSHESASLPLCGVPYVVKDNIDVAGVVTTAACPGFGYVASRNATVVAALRAAGAIVVGKANLDQFATGLVGTRSPYGTPPNVLDGRLVPGGSSSGSAVAVALGLVPFSVGTDTAGSGRVPAALNGIVGLKPTVGRLDGGGVVPAVRRLDCPSVFARTIADASAVLAAMGPRPPSSAPAGRPWPTVSAALRVGVPSRWPDGVVVDAAIERSFSQSVERLAATGATVCPLDIEPLVALGRMLYGSALVAERTLAVGDSIADGVDGLDAVVADVIRRGFGLTAVDAYRTEYELADRRAAASLVLAGVDVLALPTTPFAPQLADVAGDPFGVNDRLGTFTTFANLLGLPAIVLPLGDGTPFGLQLLAHPWCDDELVAFAATV